MKGYRTVAAAGLTILFGILAQTDWNAFLSDPKAGAVAIISGVVMVVCRALTTTPIFQSQHPAEVKEPKV